MSLLSAEVQAQLVQQLSSGEEIEALESEETEEQLEMEESEASAEIEEPEEAEDEEEAEASSGDDEALEATEEEYDPEEGHRVPYGRFKQINDRRKDLEDQMTSRDRMIEEMKERLNARHAKKEAPPVDNDWDYEAEEDEVADPEGWAAKFGAVEESNRQMQVKFARMELDREIASARAEYPAVPENYLWDSVAKDGSVSVIDAAQRYSAFVAEIEEAAIARHLDEMGATEESGKAAAPPRPKSRGASASSTSEPPSPENMDAAREAMLQYLRT